MAGDADRCYESTEATPHADCNSPIQMFLTPLPGRAGEEGPPGTVKVSFYAADGDATWEVVNSYNETAAPTEEVSSKDLVTLVTDTAKLEHPIIRLTCRLVKCNCIKCCS